MLRRRWHSAAGGRAAAAGAPAPRVRLAGSFAPTPRSSRAAAEAGAGAASGSQPARRPAKACPEPGAPRGEVPREESRRLGRVPRSGTARARAGLHGRAGAWGAGRGGRGQARPGEMRLQQPQRLGLLALGPTPEAGARTLLRGRRSRLAPRQMLPSWRAAGKGALRPGAAA